MRRVASRNKPSAGSGGVIVKSGAIVDASITDSPRCPRGKKSYVIVDERNEEEQAKEAEKSFAKEVDKPIPTVTPKIIFNEFSGCFQAAWNKPAFTLNTLVLGGGDRCTA